ncbi:MAG: hypothetical protein E7562_02020 [Ruminococcaceae bacterium]|nr:hypothetical protein [Oscillospiraceae bacterium]
MKSYNEIANSVFERRNKYIATQKRKKRIIISVVAPALCCCIVIITSFTLWEIGFFNNNIPVIDNSQNVSDDSNNSSTDNNQNSTTDNSNSSQDNNSSSAPSSNPTDNNSSQDEFIPDNSTPSDPDVEYPSEPSVDTPSTVVPSDPPVIETNYNIDSIDKINFYSAKKIISENSLFPIGMNFKKSFMSNIISLNNVYVEYPIDRNKIFTTTMVTYFTIELNDEKGFLAQKLGGTGLVEVVVTKNNIDDVGELITFKREDRYYTCLRNGGGYDTDTNITNSEFSSHKYIDGFNIVKNKLQYNFKFTVYYEGSKVIGFECAPFGNTSFEYRTDSVTFIEDFCVVLYTKQTFTIDELEVYFKNESEEEAL